MSGTFDDSVNFNMKIIPAILPNKYSEIKNGVEKIVGAVKTVQIDFVDGTFAHNRTWLFNNKDLEVLESIQLEEEALPHWDEIDYEFDLMVQDPLEHIDTFIALGPAKIIFHVESFVGSAAAENAQEKIIAYFENLPEIVRTTISFGMAIGITTDPALIAPYIPYIKTIQCMGIENVGFQGQPFDERVYKQIETAHILYPDKKIAVDGGVTLENAARLIESGASNLVVGSVVFGNLDPRGTIEELKQIGKTACKTAAPTQSEN